MLKQDVIGIFLALVGFLKAFFYTQEALNTAEQMPFLKIHSSFFTVFLKFLSQWI